MKHRNTQTQKGNEENNRLCTHLSDIIAHFKDTALPLDVIGHLQHAFMRGLCVADVRCCVDSHFLQLPNTHRLDSEPCQIRRLGGTVRNSSVWMNECTVDGLISTGA